MPLVLTIVAPTAAASGTAYISIGPGNWSNHANWSPDPGAGTYPCESSHSGDTFTIDTTITVDVAIDCGTSGPSSTIDGVVDATSDNTGALTIGSNVTMTMRGGLELKNAVLTGRDDSVLEFDPSAAASPSTSEYRLMMGTASTQTSTLIQTANTSAEHPFTIRTNSTAGNAPFSLFSVNGRAALYNLTYALIQRCGTASSDCLQMAYGGLPNKIQTFNHVTCDTCAGATASFDMIETPVSSSGWDLEDVTFENTPNPTSTHALFLNASSAAHTGIRTVNLSVFDSITYVVGNDTVWTRNAFLNDFAITGSTLADWRQFGEALPGDGMGNFIVISKTLPSAALAGTFAGNYVLINSPNTPAVSSTVTEATNSTGTGTLTDTTQAWSNNQYEAGVSTNSWFVVITGGTGAGQYRSIIGNSSSTLTILYPWTVLPDHTSSYAIMNGLGDTHTLNASNYLYNSTETFTRNVFEDTGTDDNGTAFSNIASPNVSDYILTYNLILCNSSGDNPLTLYKSDNHAKPRTIQHNTACGGGQPMVGEEEAYSSTVGDVLSFHDNLGFAIPSRTNIYRLTGGGAGTTGPLLIYDYLGVSGTTDLVAPANSTNNGAYGFLAGIAGNGFSINESSAPGTNDVSADPQFIDSTRNLREWSISRGYTVAINPLTQISDGIAALEADPTRINDLYTWVRAGFAPTNIAYHNSAYDTTDIGAIPYAAPPSISAFAATSAEVLSSGTSTLFWSVSNASSVAISPGNVSISTLIGSLTVNPTLTTVYTLTAVNSNETSTATTTVFVDNTPPTTPSSLDAIATGTSTISLTWASSTDASGPGLAGYNVFRCSGSACTPSILIATSSGVAFTDLGLSASTAYSYTVSAFDALGLTSTSSTNAEATTQSSSGGGDSGRGTGSVSIGVASAYGSASFSPARASVSSVLAPSSSTNTILSLIQAIEAELTNLEVVAGDRATSSLQYDFTRNLFYGMTGTDVNRLQQFLITHASGLAVSMLARNGTTEFFGILTYNALVEFQEKAGIHPASGYFGPITRARVNAL